MPYSVGTAQSAIIPYNENHGIITRLNFSDTLNVILNTAKQGRILPPNFPSTTEIIHNIRPSAVTVVPFDSHLTGFRPMIFSLRSNSEMQPEDNTRRNQHQRSHVDTCGQWIGIAAHTPDHDYFSYSTPSEDDKEAKKKFISTLTCDMDYLSKSPHEKKAEMKERQPLAINEEHAKTRSAGQEKTFNLTSVKTLLTRIMEDITQEQMQFIRCMVTEKNKLLETTTMHKSGIVPSLSVSASSAFSSIVEHNRPLRNPEDLQALIKYFKDSCPLPETLQKDLKRMCYAILRQIKFTTSKSLAIAVAIARITDPIRPENCNEVALSHGIELKSQIMSELRRIAAEGPAGDLVRKGTSCAVAGSEFGIPLNSPGMDILYSIAIEGLAGKQVLAGKSCTVVRREFDLPESGIVMNRLYEIAAKGPAGKEVSAGRPCTDVARTFGIPAYYDAMKALYEIAINGPATERVRNGERPEDVARALGLPARKELISRLYSIREVPKT